MNHIQTRGKDKFITFIAANKKNYKEHIDNYILMVSADGRYATTKFIVKGKYMSTDDSLLPATQQGYELEVINYFEIENNKIIKGSCWYNESEWLRQVSILS